MANIFPAEFSGLEPFADWALPGANERYEKRVTSTMEELQTFYDAAFPHLETGTAYLEKVPMDDISEENKHLLWLFCSLVTVAFPVEAWRQPRVPDSGPAKFDAVIEPAV